MSDAPRRLPPKKEVALALLQGPSLFIHLDPRKSGVVVPKWLMGQPQLVLQVGLNMAIQIPDLTVDEEGVSCTLSFNRAAFWCKLPWTAVYALVGEDGRGMIWPNDVPPEVALQMQKGAPGTAPAPAPAPAVKSAATKKAKTKLTAVADGETRTRTLRRSRAEAKSEDQEAVASSPKPEAERPKPKEVERERPKPRQVPLPVLAVAPSPDPQLDNSEDPKPSPVNRPEAGARKPKRELPPYLRVVK